MFQKNSSPAREITERMIVLVAEDEERDALLLRRGFCQAGVKADLHFVANGGQAISYLKGHPPFDDRAVFPFPNLLVIDLKMAGVDGFDLLDWLRSQNNLPALAAVVVLTGSADMEDIGRAYALGASTCLLKPPALELTDFAKSLERYWSRHLLPARLALSQLRSI